MADLTAINPEEEIKSRRTILWAEVLVIFCAVSLSVFFGVFAKSNLIPTPYYEFYATFRALTRIALILFVVWVADGSLGAIGIAKPQWGQDVKWCLVTLGLLLLASGVPLILGAHNASYSLNHLSQASPADSIPWPYHLLARTVEMARDVLIYFGYFLGRLKELLRTKWSALLCTCLLFAVIGHQFQPVMLLCGTLFAAAQAIPVLFTNRIWATLGAMAIPLSILYVIQHVGQI